MQVTVRRLALIASLAAAAAIGSACKTSVPQLPQAQTAGLRIDVQKVSSTPRKQRIDVRVKIWNDHDARVNFDLGDVRLLWNDREVSPSPDKAHDRSPDVQAKSNRVFDWVFEVGDVIGGGTYPIEIRGLQRGGQAFDQVARFEIILGE